MAGTDFDVVVVGAGPAGCAAAAAASRWSDSSRVLVVDRADFPRDKPCGDGIAAEALDALSDVGFDTDAIVAGYPPIPRLALRAPGGATVDRAMAQSVRVIPRAVFDARLVEDVRRRGITVRRHTVRTIEHRTDRVVLDGQVSAGVVIGADGAESVVRRTTPARPNPAATVALAIRGYVAADDGRPTQLITMTRRHWPAYAWRFPTGEGRANVGYGELLTNGPLRRSDLLIRLRQLLPDLPAELDDVRAHRLPLSSGRPGIADGRVLLVGDAQSLINPLTGEGIFYAVLSGGLAGTAARHGAGAGAEYRRALQRRLGRHLRHTTALARLRRFPRLIDAGVRAGARDQRVFDDLVRFGLADGLLTPRLVAGLRS
ncbi:MAG: NAD(P)/FAD-dependent oxidoreductase [bacterium]